MLSRSRPLTPLVLLGWGQVQHHEAITDSHPRVSDMFVGRLEQRMHGVQKLMSAIIQDRFLAHTGSKALAGSPAVWQSLGPLLRRELLGPGRGPDQLSFRLCVPIQ